MPKYPTKALAFPLGTSIAGSTSQLRDTRGSPRMAWARAPLPLASRPLTVDRAVSIERLSAAASSPRHG